MTQMAADHYRIKVSSFEFAVDRSFHNLENELAENGLRLEAALRNLRPSASSADYYFRLELGVAVLGDARVLRGEESFSELEDERS